MLLTLWLWTLIVNPFICSFEAFVSRSVLNPSLNLVGSSLHYKQFYYYKINYIKVYLQWWHLDFDQVMFRIESREVPRSLHYEKLKTNPTYNSLIYVYHSLSPSSGWGSRACGWFVYSGGNLIKNGIFNCALFIRYDASNHKLGSYSVALDMLFCCIV